MKIVADANIPFVQEYFGSYGELNLKNGRSISRDDVRDADILLVRSITQVNQALLTETKVKFVGSVTAGTDHLDTEWLDKNGIAYGIAKGFNAPPVADYVVSVIAAAQRKHLISSSNLQAGVIGVGNVGGLVVERLNALNIGITVCDPVRAAHEPNFQTTALQDFVGLDLILIHVPLTKNGPYPTYHFIDKDFLKRQKPGCLLVNASRGAVINSDDLLAHGKHLYWCLDVWEHEPRINKAILERAMIATPHIAGYSLQSKIRGIDMIYQLACALKIIPPRTIMPIDMPSQQLSFSGANHHWQDIILGIFNPLIMTSMMRTLLLPADDTSHFFDDMRHKFDYRHEFAFTKIAELGLSEQELGMLEKMGLILANRHTLN